MIARTLVAVLLALVLAAAVEAKVVSFGYNYYYQLGNGNSTEMHSPVEATALSGITVSTVGSGNYHVLLISDAKKLWGYGYNGYGQLGFGLANTTTADHPGQPDSTGPLNGKNVVAVAGGDEFSLALTDEGKAVGCGDNTYGQLGDGTNILKFVPTLVPYTGTIDAIAAGDSHSLALNSSGRVIAWGYNGWGQLGDGTTYSKNSPVEVDSTLMNGTVVAIAAGRYHSVAVDSDGKVFAWGGNNVGQLGDGHVNSEEHSPVLMDITNVTGKVVNVSAGYDHTLLLTDSGKVYACGGNSYGQLGDGTTVEKDFLVEVTFESKITAISAGYYHSLALTEDGKAFAWGYNNDGQLGIGSTDNKNVPTAVLATSGPLNGAKVLSVHASFQYSLLRVEDGANPDSAGSALSCSIAMLLAALISALALLL